MCLSDAVLDLALGYLDSDSLVACQATCRAVGNAAQSDDLWRSKCLEDWGEERRVRPEQRSELVSTFLESWRAWRRAFNSYHPADVKRVAMWWAGVEAWMSRNLPEVLGTLNAGVSEQELDTAEEALGWPLPTHLRLLYRFHNGQWLPWDEKLIIPVGVDEGRPEVLPKVVGSGMSLGLLGGYCFYQRMTTSKLFSLQRGVVGGLVTDASFDGDNRGYFEACANRWGTDLDTIRARGGFLLAAGPQMMKRTWVGKDGNVRFDGKSGSLMGVFDAAPVVPPSPNPDGAPGSGAGNVKRRHRGGNLMTWLEEYLRRLQCGHYMVRSKWRESIRRAGEAVPRSHLLRGVWLFPAEGGDGCVTDVTQGVEVQVSPALAPEECADRSDLVWAYSVRMQLLRDHPSRPPAMSSCQLSTRHWEIDGPDGFHREVSGDGVIGMHPTLRVAAPSAGDVRGEENAGFFEYQSITTLERTPADHPSPAGTMGGHFSFTPRDLNSPRGAQFNARVPTFHLVEPTFLY
ncbi:similar to F-box-containing protein 2 [Ectocarpus siliculosus]|uniref:Similar to F-box-containing protein 2 n=1 Tax=Ectocarpus siliculosus TaxID=2880 RepID=D7G3M2_ECTSI|nr:similar to F-box-containing protein 2 [Ectocarpus siliculosus]|eukprot:CBJ33554.1 similar to F-box-containing protein 2 [Ectocarpus siliculosus]